MDGKEREVGKGLWNSALETTSFAQSRCAELADQYAGLEVQIAVVLLAFSGLFAESIPQGFGLAAIIFKTLFAITVLFLVGSLLVGLLHIKRKEWWWHGHIEIRSARRKRWEKALVDDRVTFREMQAFIDGTNVDNDVVRTSPTWTWVLQTVFLCIGIFSLLVLQLAFIFTR